MNDKPIQWRIKEIEDKQYRISNLLEKIIDKQTEIEAEQEKMKKDLYNHIGSGTDIAHKF